MKMPGSLKVVRHPKVVTVKSQVSIGVGYGIQSVAWITGGMPFGDVYAHLLAAAPEMLAALERVGCQDKGSCGPNEPDGHCFVCHAIATAKGGAK
jgi:hypothetical protein